MEDVQALALEEEHLDTLRVIANSSNLVGNQYMLCVPTLINLIAL